MTQHSTELGPGQVQAVQTLGALVEAHDGVAALSEDTLLTLTRPGLTRFSRTDPAGEVIAFAQVHDGAAELAVHPDHRRRGHGAALLDAVLGTGQDVRVWAHGNLGPARALAERADLVRVRDLWVMSRSAPTPSQAPPVVPPSDVRVRNFIVGADEQAWLELNARAFADHPEQGRTSRADLDARIAQPWFDPAGFWLATEAEGGQLLAAMWTKITGQGAQRVGEIYVLGVDPDAQGRGLGSLLTGVAMHFFARAALARLELYVEGENTAAIAVYRKAGFQQSAVHAQYAPKNSPSGVRMPR